MKFPLENLNLGPYPPHPTSTYICGVTIAPMMCSGKICDILKYCKYDLIK